MTITGPTKAQMKPFSALNQQLHSHATLRMQIISSFYFFLLICKCYCLSHCSCPRSAAALGYRHTGCLQLSHVRTADPSASGRRSAASRTAIGGGISSRRPRGDNLFSISLTVDRRADIINILHPVTNNYQLSLTDRRDCIVL